jgi:ATP-binding cassette subfamily B protein
MILWRWLRRLYGQEPFALAWIVGWSFVSTALLVAQPLLWRALIDAIEEDPGGLRRIAAEMVGLGVAQVIAYALLQGARSWTNARLSELVRRILVRHLARLAPVQLAGWTPGDLLTRLHDDTGDKVSWLLCSGVFRAFEALLVMVAATSAIAWVAPSLAPFALAPLPLLLGAQWLAQGRLSGRAAQVQAAISRSNEEITTTFGAIRVVASSGLAASRAGHFAAASADQRVAEVKLALTQQAVQVLFGSGWMLALVGLVGSGGAAVIRGELSLGTWIAVEGWLAALVWPMFDVGVLLSRAPHAAAALARIETLLALPENRPTEVARGRALVASGVSLDRGGRRVLDGVDLTVHPGERLALTGPVGGGKSSLCQALIGQEPVAAGAVSLGGVAIGALADAERGRLLAYVPQDPVTMSVSLRENVALGRAVDVDSALATSQLALDPAIRAGDRGQRLSGGQAQRLAMARALAGRPAMLVVDDATNALDADTEQRLWAAIGENHPDAGIVVATHRPSILAGADRVLFLVAGRVAAEGRHADLLENPAYRALYGNGGAVIGGP